MRKLILTGIASLAFLTTGLAFANTTTNQDYNSPQNPKTSGLYAGLQLGYANLHYDKDWLINANSTDFWAVNDVESTGLAGRIFFGYDFNQYFGGEIGILALPKVKFNNITYDGISGFDESFRQTIIDYLVKGTFTKNNFDFVGKLGFASVFRSNIEASYGGRTVTSDATNNKLTLALGGGVNYHINQHWLTNLSYMRYFGRDDLRATDFVALGFTYRF